MPTTSLTRDDWVDAATGALLHEGPTAVAVQPLARALGATKGSFYWHFADRAELLAAALDRWAQRATDDVVARTDAGGGSPEDRLRTLFTEVTEAAVHHRGELRLLAGVDDAAVAAAVALVTDRRLAYITGLLREHGIAPATARRRAVLSYATYLGVAQLAVVAPGALPATRTARDRLRAEMVAIALV